MDNPVIRLTAYYGNNICLRPLQRSDMAHTKRWRNDPEIREYALGYRFPVTELMEEKWYETALAGQNCNDVIYTIEHITEATPIGLAYLKQIDWLHGTCEFGISIGEKRHHGKGYAREAMALLFDYAFNCLNMRKISLQTVTYNRRAISIYEKMGFKTEGVRKRHLYLSGEYHDLIIMALFREGFYS